MSGALDAQDKELYDARLCPICLGPTAVIDVRDRRDGCTKRRRECRCCGARFITLERFEAVVKNPDDTRYRRQKP